MNSNAPSTREGRVARDLAIGLIDSYGEDGVILAFWNPEEQAIQTTINASNALILACRDQNEGKA